MHLGVFMEGLGISRVAGEGIELIEAAAARIVPPRPQILLPRPKIKRLPAIQITRQRQSPRPNLRIRIQQIAIGVVVVHAGSDARCKGSKRLSSRKPCFWIERELQ